MTYDLFNQPESEPKGAFYNTPNLKGSDLKKAKFETHQQDNNTESTETLIINKRSFKGQNKLLFDLLMRGTILSFSDAYKTWGITDIRRRAKDLTDIGEFKISKDFIPGTRCKVWFMTQHQIDYNKKKLLSIK